MLRIIILFFSLAQYISSYAQIDSVASASNFYYMYNGTAIVGQNLRFHQPILGCATVEINGIRNPADSIMFLKDDSGLYVNTRYSTNTLQTGFALRTISGKYNYYRQVKGVGKEYADTAKLKRGQSYIALGYDDPIAASARNINKIFAGNYIVQNDLAKLRKHNAISAALFVAGIASAATGIAANIAKESDPRETPFFANMPAIIGGVSGAALITVGSIVIAKSPDREDIVRKANNLAGN
jgi:hypothetical protein